MKALIKVGYGCNENCTFCHTADVRHLDDSPERVSWKIERAKRLGYSMVVLSGGEPTIRPELLQWARTIASLGLDLGLVTNGLLLAYDDVVAELVERCRLRYVYMSLHGGEAKVHRSVVRADTFSQATKALSNLAGRVPDLTVNCVVTTANVGHLRGFVERVLAHDDVCVKLSMTQPKGAADRAYDVLVPDVEECAAAIATAIRFGMERARELGRERVRFAHDGVPFCLLPGLEDLYDDLKTHRFGVMIESDEDDFVPVDDVLKVHGPKCLDCARRGPCPGLYRGYAEARGDGALRPAHHLPRANSYHFVPERDVPRPRGAPCPLLADGCTPYDRARTLFLRLPDRLRLCRTETRDFADVELAETKARGQLYLDVSKKLAPDDFARDLRLLRRSTECLACPRNGECAGAYEPAPARAFEAADALVHERLWALRGSVLDVGAGEAPYANALAGLLAAKTIAYVGLDPDRARLDLAGARLRERAGAEASIENIAGSLEEAPLGERSFDHALLLRSFNHLRDPARALARLVERVRPGGELLVVDNVAFGLVRERAHARAAERGPGQREHYRNDDAARALARFEGLPVEVIEVVDVEPGRANQWLLRLRRVPSPPPPPESASPTAGAQP